MYFLTCESIWFSLVWLIDSIIILRPTCLVPHWCLLPDYRTFQTNRCCLFFLELILVFNQRKEASQGSFPFTKKWYLNQFELSTTKDDNDDVGTTNGIVISLRIIRSDKLFESIMKSCDETRGVEKKKWRVDERRLCGRWQRPGSLWCPYTVPFPTLAATATVVWRYDSLGKSIRDWRELN